MVRPAVRSAAMAAGRKRRASVLRMAAWISRRAGPYAFGPCPAAASDSGAIPTPRPPIRQHPAEFYAHVRGNHALVRE